MGAASKIISDIRQTNGAQTEINYQISNIYSRKRQQSRSRRVFLAFCAALFAVAGTYFVAGTNIPGATADENDGAAAFFRADRARIRARRVFRRASYIPVLSIFGSRRERDRTARDQRPRRIKIRSQKYQRGITGRKFSQGTRSVCVRLCDGYHFPVGDLTSKSNIKAHEAICSGLCPGAPTRLYKLSSNSTDISEAVSIRTGKAYSALPVALRHTFKRDRTCSCKPIGTPHMALVSLRRDFTLRKGDAVMTGKGIRVFKGATRLPYRNRDFASIRRARGLHKADRKTLYALERASGNRSLVRQARARQKANTRIVASETALPSIGPMPLARPRYLAGNISRR